MRRCNAKVSAKNLGQYTNTNTIPPWDWDPAPCIQSYSFYNGIRAPRTKLIIIKAYLRAWGSRPALKTQFLRFSGGNGGTLNNIKLVV